MLSVPIGTRDHATRTMMTTADGEIRGVRGSMPMAACHPNPTIKLTSPGSIRRDRALRPSPSP
jgi:hypothetical protein